MYDLKLYFISVAVAAIVFGILILIFPTIINYLIAFFFIVSGISGLIAALSS